MRLVVLALLISLSPAGYADVCKFKVLERRQSCTLGAFHNASCGWVLESTLVYDSWLKSDCKEKAVKQCKKRLEKLIGTNGYTKDDLKCTYPDT